MNRATQFQIIGRMHLMQRTIGRCVRRAQDRLTDLGPQARLPEVMALLEQEILEAMHDAETEIFVLSAEPKDPHPIAGCG